MLIILSFCRLTESLAQLGGDSSHRSLHLGKVFVDRGLSARNCTAQTCRGPTLAPGKLTSALSRAGWERFYPKGKTRRPGTKGTEY